jgi:hypothetical protein
MILLLTVGVGMFVLTLCVQMAPIAILIRIVTNGQGEGGRKSAHRSRCAVFGVGVTPIAYSRRTRAMR